MIGGAVPDDDQLVLGPFGSESAQNIDGVLAVGAGIGPEPHLAFVVEIKAVE
jgi:NAD(P)H-flavin reductase